MQREMSLFYNLYYYNLAERLLNSTLYGCKSQSKQETSRIDKMRNAGDWIQLSKKTSSKILDSFSDRLGQLIMDSNPNQVN